MDNSGGGIEPFWIIHTLAKEETSKNPHSTREMLLTEI